MGRIYHSSEDKSTGRGKRSGLAFHSGKTVEKQGKGWLELTSRQKRSATQEGIKKSFKSGRLTTRVRRVGGAGHLIFVPQYGRLWEVNHL